jgi:prephenate dehydratase
MPRCLAFDARFAPFIEKFLLAMQDAIDAGAVPTDDTLRGRIFITVAALPAEASVRVFPQVEPPVQERIAS